MSYVGYIEAYHRLLRRLEITGKRPVGSENKARITTDRLFYQLYSDHNDELLRVEVGLLIAPDGVLSSFVADHYSDFEDMMGDMLFYDVEQQLLIRNNIK